MGEHVHRVGHNQQNPLEGPGGNLPNDAFHNGGVALDKLEPGLVRLLVHPGGNHHQAAVGDVVVSPGGDVHGRAVGQTVAQVHGFPLRLLLVGIHQHQVGKQPLL